MRRKYRTVVLAVLPVVGSLLLSACANDEPIDIDTLSQPGEIPNRPGLIETQTGRKPELNF